MVMNRRKGYGFLALVALVAVLVGGWYWQQATWRSGALWRIVSQQCVPGQMHKQNPAPCQSVDLPHGFVLLKDINGPLQYLLMPVDHITGIESPVLLQSSTPNFFWYAWQARHLLSVRHGAAVPDSAVSLAINSPSGRTQNQLHIHISCLRPDIRAVLDQHADGLSSQWHEFPVAMMGDKWLARRLSEEELQQHSLFIALARQVPNAAEHMGQYSLAVVALKGGGLLALVTQRDLLSGNRASAEVLQDHSCAILNP